MRNLILSGLCIGLLLVSCDQVAEKAKDEAQNKVAGDLFSSKFFNI